MRRAAALALVTCLALARATEAQDAPEPCDPLADFGCVYAPGPGNAELRTVIDAAEWQPLPLDPWRTTSLVGLAPGSYSDGLGIALCGGTSLETTWSLDGLDIADVVYGGNSVQEALPGFLLGRVVIRRGGLGASWRGGSGGVVSLEAPRGSSDRVAWIFGRAGDWNSARNQVVSGDRSGIAWTSEESPSDVGLGIRSEALGGRLYWSLGVAYHTDGLGYVRTVYRDRDLDQNAVPDLDEQGRLNLDPIERRTLPARTGTVPVLARVDLAPGDGHELGITARMSMQDGSRYSTTDDGEIDSMARANERNDFDGAGHWRWQSGGTTVDALGGYHQETIDSRSPIESRNQTPQRRLQLDESFLDYESDAVREGCSDGAGDVFPLITNCPLTSFGYFVGGPGDIQDDIETRLQGRIEVGHQLSLGGAHRIQGGVDLSRTRFEQHYELSGGMRLFFLEEFRYVELGEGAGFDQTCAGESCRYLDSTAGRMAANASGFFISDSYSPRSDLTFEVGGRYDRQDIDRRYHLHDFLPRLSVAWDFLGGGRSRLFAATGGYAALLPLAPVAPAHQPAGYTRLDTIEMVSPPPEPLPAAAGLGPMRVNEGVVGIEAALADELRVGVTYMRRDLGRILEDTGINAPTLSNPAGRRDYDELALELRTNPLRPLSLRASYTFSRLRGDYEGFFQTHTGAVAPGTGTAFDDAEFIGNADGPLPSERPHALDVAATYRTSFGRHGLSFGARAIALSGTPRSALGRHHRYGFSEVHVLPRGSMGRTPHSSFMSLRLAYSISPAHGVRYELFADLINAFDHQEVARFDQNYTTDSVSPIIGGTTEDLVFLKRRGFGDGSETSELATRWQNFGQPTSYYMPFAGWVGLRLTY